MTSTHLLSVFLLAITCQVLTSPVLEGSNFDKFKDWIAKEGDNLKTDIEQAVNNVKEHYKTEVEKHKKLIESKFEASLVLADSYPNNLCTKQLKFDIESLKRNKIWDFLNCHNLTTALEDVGNILLLSINVTGNVAASIDMYISAFSQCTFLHPWCYVEQANKIREEIENDFSMVKQFGEDVYDLGKDITANIKYCTEDHSGSIESQLNKIFTKANKCEKIKL